MTVLKSILYPILILVTLNIGLYFYWSHKHINKEMVKAHGNPAYAKHFDSETLKRVGWFKTERKSQFFNYEKKKDQGVIRFAVLGDSFSYGDEVAKDLDFATQLEELFKENNINAEVLNFGIPGISFSQAYFLWEGLAKKYQIDHIILGPYSFFPEREVTFSTYWGRTPHFTHSRFIIDGSKLKSVHLKGKSIEEQINNYNSLLPDPAVLKYDFFAPPFINAWLPHLSYIKNPFYYRSDIETEGTEIQIKLINKMSEDVKSIILVQDRTAFLDKSKGKLKTNVKVNHLSYMEGLRYIPPFFSIAHFSPTSNWLLANRIKDLYLQKSESFFPKLNNYRYSPKKVTDEVISQIHFSMNGVAIGKYFKLPFITEEEAYDDFSKKNILIAYDKEYPLLKSQLILTDLELNKYPGLVKKIASNLFVLPLIDDQVFEASIRSLVIPKEYIDLRGLLLRLGTHKSKSCLSGKNCLTPAHNSPVYHSASFPNQVFKFTELENIKMVLTMVGGIEIEVPLSTL